MKKVLLLYGLLVLVLLILYFVKSGATDFLIKKNAVLSINGNKIVLERADSEKERMIGLTQKTGLTDDQGMIFIFPTKGKYSFWTKNMKFPIDIIFLNDNKVMDIFKDVPPANSDINIPTVTSQEQTNYVIELSSGNADKNNIKLGDQLTIENL